MQIAIAGNAVTVFLSERNMKQLLVALDNFEASNSRMEPYLERVCEDGTFLRLVAQTDSEHYERLGRKAGPGFEGWGMGLEDDEEADTWVDRMPELEEGDPS